MTTGAAQPITTGAEMAATTIVRRAGAWATWQTWQAAAVSELSWWCQRPTDEANKKSSKAAQAASCRLRSEANVDFAFKTFAVPGTKTPIPKPVRPISALFSCQAKREKYWMGGIHDINSERPDRER